MAITALPTPPSRQQPEATFVTNADNFLGALPTFVTEANALTAEVNGIRDATEAIRVATAAIRDTAEDYKDDAASSAAAASDSQDAAALSAASASASAASAVNAPGTSATSTTTMSVALGYVEFDIQPGKAFVPGQFLVVASTVSPINYMLVQIQEYDTVSGEVLAIAYQSGGSGAFSSWSVAMAAVSNAYLPSAKIFFMMGR